MVATTERGREAFDRRAWREACDSLVAAARRAPLDVEDLERLAVAAHLAGEEHESMRAWEQAHLVWLRLGDADRAGRCAFWLGFDLLLRGQMAPAQGWLARGSRVVDDAGADCVARGYLLIPDAFLSLDEDPATAQTLAAEAAEIGRRFGDPDLLALAVLTCGEAAVAAGDVAPGLALLDEAMVAVTAGEVSPLVAGLVYCAVIIDCMHAFDLRRAAEWTEALSRWCDSQPELVHYRGQCLVHRSQVFQAHGEWAEAATEAERACLRLSDPPHAALGEAYYQQAEIHRLRGELAEAEEAYRQAGRHGREATPGFALLRLADGRVDAAVAAVRRMFDETRGQDRPLVLAAYVEIMLATGDVDAARTAADELAEVARAGGAPLLQAIADYAEGTALLAAGDIQAALGRLRRACRAWRELGMPYEAARARVVIGQACRAVGDHDAAGVELDTARDTFERLGARLDLERLDRLADPAARTSATGAGATPLTGRECEVLRLVASGCTNREVAEALVISEHTVGRHLQNIFAKLGVSSRAAATAYAYEHGLV